MAGSKAFQPFTLPNGSQLKNRIAKAAMEEKMADIASHNQPSPQLIRLYKLWGDGGAGLILSGHIMIDPRAMAAPADVLLASDSGELDESRWRKWIDSTQANGAQFWLQINHPGRQIRKGSGLPTYGPSAVPLKLGRLSGMFPVPEAMTEEQILNVIERFAWAAKKAEELGAKGVEIHAAHGYLLSAFLSPLSNERTDRWGGSAENRARLLFEVIAAVRKVVTPGFGVGVKINTADFQRGGFEVKDLYDLVERLNGTNIDLLEISGGSYESPAMAGHKQTTSTGLREAYFLEAAKSIEKISTVPIMVTGGIRHYETLEGVIESSDKFLAGVGSAIGLLPDLPLRWQKGEDPAPSVAQSWALSGSTYSAAKIVCVSYNMQLYGSGKQTWLGVWPLFAMITDAVREYFHMGVYKGWIGKPKL